jgi:hypothetical protein
MQTLAVKAAGGQASATLIAAVTLPLGAELCGGELPIVKIGRSTRYDLDRHNNRAGIAIALPQSVTLQDLIVREGEGD